MVEFSDSKVNGLWMDGAANHERGIVDLFLSISTVALRRWEIHDNIPVLGVVHYVITNGGGRGLPK